jgi:hypothetical protein
MGVVLVQLWKSRAGEYVCGSWPCTARNCSAWEQLVEQCACECAHGAWLETGGVLDIYITGGIYICVTGGICH